MLEPKPGQAEGAGQTLPIEEIFTVPLPRYNGGMRIVSTSPPHGVSGLQTMIEDSQTAPTPTPKKGASATKVRHYFLSVGQAAHILGMTSRTVLRWCETGVLPAITKPYGNKTTFLISPAALETFKVQSSKTPKVARHHKDFFDSWVKALETGLFNGKPFSPRTTADYRGYMKTFFARYQAVSLGTLKAALSAVPVQQFATREKLYKSIVCYARFLISKGQLAESFMDDVKTLCPKRHRPPRRKTVDEAGLNKMLVACDNPLDRALVAVLGHTGLRASELCALRADDIDLGSGFLVVQLGKGGKRRKVGLNQEVVVALRDHLGDQREGAVFLNRIGEPMTRSGLYQRLQRIAKAAGVVASPHALRRAFVTINANRGRPLQMLQRACGHSNIQTTMGYCMTTEQELIQAMRDW